MTLASTQDISAALNSIRVLRRQRNICMAPFFAVFLVGIPLALVDEFSFGIVSGIWHSSWFNTVWVLLWAGAIVGFLLSFLMEWRIGAAKCPKCRRAFHSGPSPRWGFVRNTYARKCLHCGLRLDGSNIGEH